MNGSRAGVSENAVQGSAPVLKHYIELLKFHLCAYIALSAVFGHVMALQKISPDSFFLGAFVFLLACGSAVLNNIQDMEFDTFFKRTCNRSLPQKKVPVPHAAGMAVLLILAGLSGVFFVFSLIPTLAGLAALISYNGLYTPLKKRSLLAILPGSLCGMLPPLMGWTAAGGYPLDPKIILLMLVFGLWQVPHFFIILIKNGNASPDCQSFPSFSKIFSETEIKLQTLIWTSLYSLSILLFALNGFFDKPVLFSVSFINALVIIALVSAALFKKITLPTAFATINLSMLLFMGSGICGACFA
ncbi:MAG: hypothetical protein A2277_01035 [Desulfobacterales bacterium RIFOXYA12_FULL_46_15]|nr:MAG: hypothetical protein A2277_01035 [Desulfobacterales bacterium RIFOXYA12_FULL_46_15]